MTSFDFNFPSSEFDPKPTMDGGYGSMATGGLILAAAGAVTQAIGGFYAAKSAKYEAKSAALTAEFQASMANLNARVAEQDAQHIIDAGQKQAGMASLEYAQAQAAYRARTAGRGVQAGVGSAGEVAASIDYAKQSDILTINTNAYRAAGQRRMQVVDYRNQAALGMVSAANLRRSASSIRPYMAAGTSLLGSAGSFAQQWAQSERFNAYFAGRN